MQAADAPSALLAGASAAPQTGSSDLLQLMWLASPALPIGGFSYSEVLEAAVESIGLRAPSAVGAWLCDQLHLVQARSEMPILALALAAWRTGDHAQVNTLNAWVLQTRESSELRLQSEQMGRSMMDWLRQLHAGTPARVAATQACSSPTYPIAFALAASFTGADAAACLHSHAFGWAENMVQAAVKAVPLGQSAGQRILAELVQQIPAAVAQALARAAAHDRDTMAEREPADTMAEADHMAVAVAVAVAVAEGGAGAEDAPDRAPAGIDGPQAFAPMLAILSAQHETQYSRLFRS